MAKPPLKTKVNRKRIEGFDALRAYAKRNPIALSEFTREEIEQTLVLDLIDKTRAEIVKASQKLDELTAKGQKLSELIAFDPDNLINAGIKSGWLIKDLKAVGLDKGTIRNIQQYREKLVRSDQAAEMLGVTRHNFDNVTATLKPQFIKPTRLHGKSVDVKFWDIEILKPIFDEVSQ